MAALEEEAKVPKFQKKKKIEIESPSTFYNSLVFIMLRLYANRFPIGFSIHNSNLTFIVNTLNDYRVQYSPSSAISVISERRDNDKTMTRYFLSVIFFLHFYSSQSNKKYSHVKRLIVICSAIVLKKYLSIIRCNKSKTPLKSNPRTATIVYDGRHHVIRRRAKGYT